MPIEKDRPSGSDGLSLWEKEKSYGEVPRGTHELLRNPNIMDWEKKVKTYELICDGVCTNAGGVC